jgi:hypothetical protein
MKKPEFLPEQRSEQRSDDKIFDSIIKKAKSASETRFGFFCIAIKMLCKVILALLLICNFFTATSFAMFCATPTMHIALYYVLPALSVSSLLFLCLFLCRLDPEERRWCVKGSCTFSAIFFGLLFLGKALYHLCLSGQLGLFFTHPLIAVPTAVIGVVAVVILLVMCVPRGCGGVEDEIKTAGRERLPVAKIDSQQYSGNVPPCPVDAQAPQPDERESAEVVQGTLASGQPG